MFRKIVVLIVICWAWALPAYAQTPIPMPDFVLAAARAINARHGQIININAVGWNYRYYSISGTNLSELCPNVESTRPPFPSGSTTFTIVTFNTPQTWRYLVYENQSYFGPCELQAPPTAIPVVPSFTPIISLTPSPTRTPTITPTPTITLTPSNTPTITLTPSPTLTLTPSFTPTLVPTLTLTPTPSGCFGLVSRLMIGQAGWVTPGEPNNLRETFNVRSAKLGEIPGGAAFTVLDGPRCSLDGTWWFVEYNGVRGWTLEGRETVYYVEPLTAELAVRLTAAPLPTATPLPPTPIASNPNAVICNPALPPRLQAGIRARVTPGGSANNVRAQEGRSSQYVGEIPPGGVFTVLEGPRCTGDGAWWRIDYNGLQGWTIEGMEGAYWLEPEFAQLPRIDSTNLNQLQLLPRGLQSIGEADLALLSVGDTGVIELANATGIFRMPPVDGFAPLAELSWFTDTTVRPTNDRRWIGLPLQNSAWQLASTATERQLFTAAGELWLTLPTNGTTLDAFSGDGRWWAWGMGTEVYLTALARNAANFGQAQLLSMPQPAPLARLLFSEDGRWLAAITDLGNQAALVYLWDTTTGQLRLVQQISVLADTEPLFARIATAQLSPDGRWLAFTVLQGGKLTDVVQVVELVENGVQTQLTAANADFLTSLVFVDGTTLLAGGGIVTPQQGVWLSFSLPSGAETLRGSGISGSVSQLMLNPSRRLLVIRSSVDTTTGLLIAAIWKP
jgi:hypothetical protein